MQRKCTKCEIYQDIEEFGLMRGKPNTRCKSCIRVISKLYYSQNRARCLQRQRQYHYKNRKARLAYMRENYSRLQLCESARASRRKYKKANPEKDRAYVAKRRKRTVPFSDLAKITHVYWVCELVTQITGVVHEVDHIVPLNHPKVSGLHVHTNLQILTQTENRKKGNKYVL